MFYILKGLYYEYKVRAYEKEIIKTQAARDKLKAKQARATTVRESYSDKIAAHKAK